MKKRRRKRKAVFGIKLPQTYKPKRIELTAKKRIEFKLNYSRHGGRKQLRKEERMTDAGVGADEWNETEREINA